MKNILVTLIILLFISCNEQNTKTDNSEWSGTISASDERNDLVNKFVDAYENKDSEAALSIFSDDAVFNVNDSKLTPKETIEGFMLGHEYYILYTPIFPLCHLYKLYWFYQNRRYLSPYGFLFHLHSFFSSALMKANLIPSSSFIFILVFDIFSNVLILTSFKFSPFLSLMVNELFSTSLFPIIIIKGIFIF